MTDTVLGNPISMAWDSVDEVGWIVFRDSAGEEVFRCHRELWENETAGFTPEMRDMIITKIGALYG